MKRLVSILFLPLFLITACIASSVQETPEQSVEPTPTLFPSTPLPPKIDAPLVEAPELTSIYFINSTDGWGVTETQIVRTNDGGSTWYNVTPPNVTETGFGVDMSVLDNDHVWVNMPNFENYPNSGFLYRTVDGGVTWATSNSPFSRGHLRFLDANNGWALADLGVGAGSNAVAVHQTTDGGETWVQTYINDPNNTSASDSLPLGGLKFDIVPYDMTSAWVHGFVYAPGTAYLYRTSNAGQLWEQASIPLPPGVENVELAIDQMEFVTANDAFLTMRLTSDATSLAVYASNDSGITWTLTPTPIPDGRDADFLSADEIVIYTGNQFYVTRDAARTWTIIPPDIDFSDTFLAMDFVSPVTGWVLTIDPTTNHRALYKTGDGGETWFPIVP